MAEPFLKWVGGKRQLLPELRRFVPAFGTYYEPFVGGGALFFDIEAKRACLADANEELVRTYRAIRDDIDTVIAILRNCVYDSGFFSVMRAKDPTRLDDVECAARMIYLNRTCFNGVYRVNAAGEFNVPMGRYTNPLICNEPVLRAAATALKTASIDCADFERVALLAETGDFVYFDPPYIPLSETSSFTKYTSNGFGPVEHERLAALFDQLDQRGVFVLASNADVEWVRQRYALHHTHQVLAKRNINSKAGKRGSISELIIVGRALFQNNGGMTVAKRKTVGTKKSKTEPVSINEDGVETESAEPDFSPVATSPSADDPFGFGTPANTPAPANSGAANGNGHVGTNLMGTPLGLSVGVNRAAQAPAQISFTPTVGGITPMMNAKIEPFNSMKANLKGISGDVPLAPLMAVCGGNRRGKTATRVAFEMGITGKAPGCVHAQDFMEYAPANADEVSSMLISSSGSAHYEVKDGKKPPEKPEYFGALKVLDNVEARERALPAATMKSFLVGDVKARRAIFQRFGHGAAAHRTGVPLPKGLNSDQTVFWNTTLAEIAENTSDVSEILAEMNRVMASKKLALGKEATAAEKQLKEANARLAEAAAGAELLPQFEEDYKKAIAYENLENTRRQLQLAEQEFQQLEVQAQEFLRKDGELGQWGEKFTMLEEVLRQSIDTQEVEKKQYADEAATLAPRLKRIQALDDIFAAMIQANATTFPILDVEIDPVACRNKLAAIIQERAPAHEQLQARIRTIDQNVQAAKDQLAREKASYDQTKARHESLRSNLKTTAATSQARIQALQQALASAPAAVTDSSESVKAKIEALRTTESTRTLVGELEATVRAKRNEQAIAKVLEKEAETLLQNLLQQVAGGAETAVNKYMPQSFVAKLDLSGGGCEWRSVGADGRPHNRHTMCGAEKASLLVALALAWTEGAPARFLTLDDEDLGPFHSSPENLQALLTKIAEAVSSGSLTQAMVCGVRKDEVPAGWLVIER